MLNKALSIEVYQKIAEARQPRKIHHFHASSIARCPRALYFERKGVQALSEPTGAKILRWETGHALEASIRPYLKALYPNLISNVRLTNKTLDCTGEFDNYDPDSKTLIEIKSVHPYAVITRQGQTTLKLNVAESGEKAKWEPKPTPYLNHEYQNHAYALLMKHPDTTVDHPDSEINEQIPLGVTPVEKITYIYVTLGGLLVSYTTPVKPDVIEAVEGKLRAMREYWAGDIMPPCNCHEGKLFWGEVNQWCDFKSDDGCCNPKLLEELK